MKTRKNLTCKQKRRGLLLLKNGILLIILALSTLYIVGCVKTEADYPGISIYKTNSDYFELVDIGVKNGKIIRKANIYHGSSLEFSESDTVYKRRIRLANGYILDTEANVNDDAYLSLTWKVLFLKEIKTIGHILSNDTLQKYIIDTNPYKEFYQETKYPQKFLPTDIIKDTAEINAIIRDGDLGKYFERKK